MQQYVGHIQEEKMAICYVYLNGSPYRDAEGLSKLRSCLHNEIINAAPRIGGGN